MTSLEVVHVGHHLPYQCTVSSRPSFALDINLSNLTQSVSLGMLLQVPLMDLICISFQLLTYKNIQTSCLHIALFTCITKESRTWKEGGGGRRRQHRDGSNMF